MSIKVLIKYYFSVVLFVLLSTYSVNAQDVPASVDVNNVNPYQISDTQLEKAIDNAEKQGYNQQQIESAARLKGMSEVDISNLRNRILELKNQNDGNNADFIDLDVLRDEFELDLEDGDVNFDPTADPPNLNEDIYGRSIFKNRQLNFAPNLNIPTPKEYLLGTGDQLTIDIWGASEKTYQVSINPEGLIKIPSLGPIYLSGLSIELASKKIISQMTKLYDGLKGQNKNTYAQVSLSSIRSIKVTIVGEVDNPGTYTLSSLSTIFHALYLAGGTSYMGNLRDIALYRANKKIVSLDVYDFLKSGDMTNNLRLEDQDLIMILPYNKRVSINGEVKRPMIYELKPDDDLADLIEMASGFTDDAYPSLVTVNRKNDYDLEIITLKDKNFKGFQLKPSDKVHIASIYNVFENRVEIKGAVFRPGYYQLTDSMTLKDLIDKSEGVLRDAFLARGLITRYADDLSQINIRFNLKDVLDGKSDDILLKYDDIIYIKSKFDLEEYKFVSIIGQVINPTSVNYHENLTIEDVIYKANGFTNEAKRNILEISRRIPADSEYDLSKEAEVFIVEINELLDTEDASDFVLEPYDQIIVRKSPVYKTQKNVSIIGEVVESGFYTIQSRNERVSSLIERAGGVTAYAYIDAATVIRNGKHIALELEEIFKNPSSNYDYYLMEGDVINVPVEIQTVTVEGEIFRREVTIGYDKNQTFKSYISKSGGFTDQALKKRSFVIHANQDADRVRNFLFFNSYPEISPGAKIIIPKKPERNRRLSIQEILAITTSLTTMVFLIDRIAP
jgi:protein involved in polysaccharide export with SLBB domain